MEHANELVHRLTELEIKSAFNDDLLDALNRQVAHQQEQIGMLVREMLLLRQSLASGGGDASATSLRDELPPHY